MHQPLGFGLEFNSGCGVLGSAVPYAGPTGFGGGSVEWSTTMRKNTKKTTKAVPVPADYADAVAEAKAAGAAFKRWGRHEGEVTLKCAEATRTALRTGYLHTAEGDKPEGAVSRAEFARTHFDLANGSLVTFWITLAGCLSKGVDPTSTAWKVLSTGPKVARKGGVAEKVAEAQNSDDIDAIIRAEGIDPNNGEKIAGFTRPTRAPRVSKDPVADCAKAFDLLKAALPKVEKGDSPEYRDIRKRFSDLFVSQDKGRKSGRYAAGTTAKKATARKVA